MIGKKFELKEHCYIFLKTKITKALILNIRYFHQINNKTSACADQLHICYLHPDFIFGIARGQSSARIYVGPHVLVRAQSDLDKVIKLD